MIRKKIKSLYKTKESQDRTRAEFGNVLMTKLDMVPRVQSYMGLWFPYNRTCNVRVMSFMFNTLASPVNTFVSNETRGRLF